MRAILHIVTASATPLAREVIASQREDPENEVRVVEVGEEDADYKALLHAIFEADSVQVW